MSELSEELLSPKNMHLLLFYITLLKEFTAANNNGHVLLLNHTRSKDNESQAGHRVPKGGPSTLNPEAIKPNYTNNTRRHGRRQN